MERAADAKGMRVGTDLVEAAGALARLERVDGAEADQDARIHQADQERVVVHALADQHAALSTSVEFRSPVSTTNKPKKKMFQSLSGSRHLWRATPRLRNHKQPLLRID